MSNVSMTSLTNFSCFSKSIIQILDEESSKKKTSAGFAPHSDKENSVKIFANQKDSNLESSMKFVRVSNNIVKLNSIE